MRSLPLALLTAAVLVPGPANAALPQQSGAVDLRTQFDGRVKGQSASEAVTGVVAGIGDFNGDGLSDMATTTADGSQGTARVVFGVNGVPDVQLAEDRQIQGGNGGAPVASASRAITSLAGIGDMNGDGKADMVVGSCTSTPSDAGRAWVVFGRAGTAAINLDALGTGGFLIDGTAGQCLGASVAGAGDVNGDGRVDVILGAPKADGGNGAAVVVFGKTDGNPATPGYTMLGPGDSDAAGTFVAGLGDVNGDGRADTGVGAPNHTPASGIGSGAGAVWVVFGRVVAPGTSFPLGTIGPSGDTMGFRIDGPGATAALGPVAGAGDVNADGKADVAVGAPQHDNPAENGGSVSVVFGKPDATEVATAGLGDRGYRFINGVALETFGAELRGPADLNSDGVPDIAAGSPLADPNGQKDAGTIYVLFGRPGVTGGATDDALGTDGGFRVAGPRAGIDGSQTPSQLGGPGTIGLGDLNGDGRPDLLSGVAQGQLSGGATDPGTAFLTLGFGVPAFRVPATYNFAVAIQGTPVLPTDIKRTGAVTFAISPALPAGLTLDTATGAIAGKPDDESTTRHTLTMTDLAGTTGRVINIVIGPGLDVVAPVISKARLTHKKFRVGARQTALEASAKKKKKRPPFGTRLRMNVSEAVSLTIVVKCAKPIGKKRKKFCSDKKKGLVGKRATFRRKVGRGGDTVFAFSGRVSKLKLLPGRYTFTVTATDAVKLVSKPVVVKFTVVK